VLAPPEVQSMVAARLSEPAGQAGDTPPARPAPAPRSASPAPSEQTHTNAYLEQIELKRATADSVESSLASIFGNRLVSIGTTAPGTMSYRLRLNDGGEVTFTVDRGAGRFTYTAAGAAATAFPTLIRALDNSEQGGDHATRLVPLTTTRTADAKRTVEAIRVTNTGRESPTPAGREVSADVAKKLPLAAQILRPGKRTAAQVVADAQVAPAAPPNAAAPIPGAAAQVAPGARGAQEDGGLIGPVQIEMLEGLDVLVIRGNARDVKQVMDIIQQIEKLSIETEPAIEVFHLHEVDCTAMSTLVTQLYSQVYAARQGTVTISR